MSGKPCWKIAGGRVAETERPYGIMGILNLTPDSFFDGGLAADPVEKAGALLLDGADIIDIGAESTRPGADAVCAGEEIARLGPLAEIRKRHPAAVISVDTRNSRTARHALEAGADIINDVSACCSHDPGLLDVVCQFRPGYVLMHSQGSPRDMQKNPCYDDVVGDISRFFEHGLARLTAAGLPEDRIALDPGIGFGKTAADNVRLMASVGEFLRFGRPLLVGLSMKSLFGALLDLQPGEREGATSVCCALLWERGVFWHRVHKVKSTRDALECASFFRA